MYDIMIEYTTGNSFAKERKKEPLCNPVTNLEDAKENLKRIKNHYVENRDNPNADKRFELDLVTDNGGKTVISPFWIGYFEILHGAVIILDGDDDMQFQL